VPDPRQPLARQLYQLLLERICRFELEPGRLISEASLSATLGVSRTPVREAMARLAEQGLVEVMPQRGSRVLPCAAAIWKSRNSCAKHWKQPCCAKSWPLRIASSC
jgi:DNA-binding GntR family transcriptional regulator